MTISVITVTKRIENLNLIANNFTRQEFPDKELIIILNLDNIYNLKLNKLPLDSSISVYLLGSSASLGKCLNFGISNARYDYIAKMDDDDFYGQNYLSTSLSSLLDNKADIVGKSSIYIYFMKESLLGLRHSGRENRYVNRVQGSTLFFKKAIFPGLYFPDRNLGEDASFCDMAVRNGFKVYSTSKDHYVYLRNDNQNHTWKIDNSFLIRECIKCGNKKELDSLIERWKKNKK